MRVIESLQIEMPYSSSHRFAIKVGLVASDAVSSAAAAMAIAPCATFEPNRNEGTPAIGPTASALLASLVGGGATPPTPAVIVVREYPGARTTRHVNGYLCTIAQQRLV